jgi:type IV secretory pathway TraG/TraD family ATPase VirD4
MKSGFDLIRPKRSSTFGSAEWMSWRNVQEMGLDTFKNRPWLGYLPYSTSAGVNLSHLYANQNGHIFTAGAARSGKGTTQIIPNLLHWPYSTIVIDVKSENYDLTQNKRQEFGPVYHFSPFRESSYSFNPLDFVGSVSDPDEQEDRSRYLAELLVPLRPDSKDPYFEQAARTLVRTFLLWVATTTGALSETPEEQEEAPFFPAERTLAEIVRLLKQEKEQLRLTLKSMQDVNEHHWVRTDASAQLRLLEAEKQFAGVVETAIQNMNVWASGRVRRVTRETNIPISEFRSDPSSLYLMVPPDEMDEYRGVFRAIIGIAIKLLKDNYDDSQHEDWPPVLFLLDEFTQLGAMDPIAHGLNYLAGYGLCLWTFVQSLEALKKVYPNDWGSFIANSPTRCFFGVNDHQTAKLVSDMVGIATVQNRSLSTNSSISDAFGTNRSSGWSSGPNGGSSSSNSGTSRTTTYSSGTGRSVTDAQRALYTPDEVMRLGPKEQIIFMQGAKPILARRLPYYDVQEWRDQVGKWLGDRGNRTSDQIGSVTPPHLMRRATFGEAFNTKSAAPKDYTPPRFEDDD